MKTWWIFGRLVPTKYGLRFMRQHEGEAFDVDPACEVPQPCRHGLCFGEVEIYDGDLVGPVMALKDPEQERFVEDLYNEWLKASEARDAAPR